MRIIFPNDSGGVSVIIPAPGFSAEDCLSAVPFGSPYRIVDDADIPSNREYRAAWTHDFTGAPIK